MLLGLHGKLGSGKDTVLERLQHLYPGLFVRHSFADKLKDSACALLGIDRDEMERLKRMEDFEFLTVWNDGDTDVHFGITMRTFLQRYGTESHRDVFGQDFWVNQTMGPALEDEANHLVPVFTDTRFPNEGESILVQFGQVWLIEGPKPPCTCDEPRDHLDVVRLPCPLHDAHSSETPLPASMIDRTIDNTVRDDGYANLDRQLREAVDGLIAERYIVPKEQA